MGTHYKINEKLQTRQHRELAARLGQLGAVTVLALLASFGLPADIAEPVQAKSENHIEIKHTEESQESLLHKVTATVYWIGEEAGPDNDFISNTESSWDSDAVGRFGGIDDPAGRDFTPLHNPYYFALPAEEFDEHGLIRGAREASPWSDEAGTLTENVSLFKGRWVRLMSNGREAYAQWHDVGPNVECDYGYVFGDDEPSNTFGEQAGIDLSPEAAASLQIDGSGEVTWQFVDDDEVPDGPWKQFPIIDNLTHWDSPASEMLQ